MHGGSTSRPPEVTVDAVSKRYRSNRGDVLALAEISTTIDHGQFVSILGPSGCGKSTLLKIVAGLTTRTAGTVLVQGREVTKPQTQIGLVFQNPVLLPWRSVIQNVLIQAEARNLPGEAARHRAQALLESVGLDGFHDKRPHELSGGMQQRVAICRALLHDPKLILMDEPFGALDAITRDQMGVDLERLWTSSVRTMLFVTHSIAEAVFLSDRVLMMSPRPGRVVLDLLIELPRPRTLDVRDTPEFVNHCATLRRALESTGALRASL